MTADRARKNTPAHRSVEAPRDITVALTTRQEKAHDALLNLIQPQNQKEDCHQQDVW